MAMRNKCLSAQGSSLTLSSLLSSNLDTSSANVKDFLALVFTNSISNSYKITINFEYFPPDDSTGQNVFHGVHFSHYSHFSWKYIVSKSSDNMNCF